MTELRNIEAELGKFRRRIVVASCFVLFAFAQVVRHEDFEAQAESNRTAIVPIVPNRGLIMDRNGITLATNYSAYTLEITPSKVEGTLDELIEQLSALVEV
jgi:penicillin-binding protein 2